MRGRVSTVSALALCMVLTVPGCIHVRQLVKMNHDGSGTLTETVRVLPRTIRLLKRSKGHKGNIALLTDQALEKRIKSFGAVTVKSKARKALPDGSLQLKTVMTFKDINKVNLWMVPMFRGADPKMTGSVKLRYRQVVRGYNRDPRYYRKDLLDVRVNRRTSQTKVSSPVIAQNYRDVTPAFRDMLKDFRFEIQIQAPDDLETFEDKRHMVTNMPFDANVVTPYRVYGENAIVNSELIRGFLMGEVGGHSDAWGGAWRPLERSLPNTYTPYGSGYGGMHVQFFKTIVVPKPGSKKEKK